MPTAEPPRGNLYPSFCYADAPRALEFLEHAFGFRRRLVVPGPGGTILHSELEFEGGVVMVSSPKPERDWRPPEGPGRSAGLCVRVADPDAHFARAKAAGARIVQELRNEDYGSRGYIARDPEGHEWYFGTYVPGAHWDPR